MKPHRQRPHRRNRLLALAVLLATPASAQQPAEPPLTRIEVGGAGVLLGSVALSPDGRWIVVGKAESSNRSSLWLAPAGGGELVRLTDPGYLDDGPVWSPSGDRIFFTSNRPARGEPGYFIMTLRIDPRTGGAVDAPRQVTLERESALPVASPDGRQLLYRNGAELRVVPAAGGTSRTVITLPRMVMRYAWAADGQSIYYAVPEARGQVLYRVSTSGGTPTELFHVRGRNIQAISPAAERVVAMMFGPGFRERSIEVYDWNGRLVARRAVSGDIMVRGMSADGRAVLLVSSDVGAVMRARPVAGGDPIDLTDGTTYDWPMAWTADSRSVIVSSVQDERPVVRVLPLAGGTQRTIALPTREQRADFVWATPTHVAYRIADEDGIRNRVVAFDMATGAQAVLSEDMRRGIGPIGPGGLYRGAEGFYFKERNGDRIDIREVVPGKAARTLFSASPEFIDAHGTAYHGDRFAYVEMIGDSVGVRVVDSPGAAPRVLLTLGLPRSRENCCRRTIAFSHDGTWIVAEPSVHEPNIAAAIVARVPAQGRATDIRRVNLEAEYWYEPRWMPDNSGFTAIAGSGATAWVVFVPTAQGGAVRHLSRAEDQATWGNELSPDGRYVVYPAEVWRGSTLWRLDLR
jgi:Tol biopolymer transport system component